MNLIEINTIKSRIYTVRGKQVMLDRDLAKLYDVKARRLREQVKRNRDRFPIEFMFQLNDSEVDFMVSQNAIPSRKSLGGFNPYVFTEQGVSMLSAVLRSKIAIKVSIQIINAFVEMRKFLLNNAQVFQRLDSIESKQLVYDDNFDKIFKAIEDKSIKPNKAIFFDGQMFDAYNFVSDLVRYVKKEIILIDNYIDDSVLTLFSKCNKNVKVKIYTKKITKQLKLDLEKYNEQYGNLEIKEFGKSHDRFLIIDGKDIYHIGASVKDLGKKWFAFSKFDVGKIDLIRKLK
jgi:hypothetical protein